MNWKTKKLKELANILLNIKEKNDMLNFLRDVCTLEELESISSRWQAVQLINQGISYRIVAKKTGLSTTTVTRVAHWLNNGEGGYKKALDIKKE